jgi:hypothetical protein
MYFSSEIFLKNSPASGKRSRRAISGSPFFFVRRMSREPHVLLAFKPGTYHAVDDRRRQCATVEILSQSPQIFRVGTDVPHFKRDATGLQESLGLNTRTTPWFRVEMNRYLQSIPTTDPGSSCIRLGCGGAIRFERECARLCKRVMRFSRRIQMANYSYARASTGSFRAARKAG